MDVPHNTCFPRFSDGRRLLRGRVVNACDSQSPSAGAIAESIVYRRPLAGGIPCIVPPEKSVEVVMQTLFPLGRQ